MVQHVADWVAPLPVVGVLLLPSDPSIFPLHLPPLLPLLLSLMCTRVRSNYHHQGENTKSIISKIKDRPKKLDNTKIRLRTLRIIWDAQKITLKLWKKIVIKLKNENFIFHSVQHIPHLLCKDGHFWRGQGWPGLHTVNWEKSNHSFLAYEFRTWKYLACFKSIMTFFYNYWNVNQKNNMIA